MTSRVHFDADQQGASHNLNLPVSFVDAFQRVKVNTWAAIEAIGAYERSVEPARSVKASVRFTVRIEDGEIDPSWRIIERAENGRGGWGRTWRVLLTETGVSGRFITILAEPT